MLRYFFLFLWGLSALRAVAAEPLSDAVRSVKKVYVFPIREEIMPSVVRLTDKCLREAERQGADFVVIDMNTYGGLVDAADSVRTRILNFARPVYLFVNNQAASAGALIALAADSVWMRDGASMGAATVVGQDGTAMPDKYQSFMRGMMRATAEAHGKVPDVTGGDTVWRWHRDPLVAEAMVDPSVVVPGLVDSTKVLTFSANEAVKWHFAEGKASSVEQLLAEAGVTDYEIYEYQPTGVDKLLGFLTNPAFQGVMIMLIIGGIYFELQTPGLGFPSIVAVVGTLLYFAPLYLEGMLANWELIVFIVGIILIVLEIFVTPGFGVLGILGIIAVVLGLTFAMIDSDLLRYVTTGEVALGYVFRPLGVVIISVAGSLLLCFWLGKRFLTGHSRLRDRVVLTSSMSVGDGYVSRATDRGLVGRKGVTATALRPAGKVLLDEEMYEAAGENGLFIPGNRIVTIVRDEGGVLYCREIE